MLRACRKTLRHISTWFVRSAQDFLFSCTLGYRLFLVVLLLLVVGVYLECGK